MNQVLRLLGMTVVFGLVWAGASAQPAGSDCSADVSVSLDREDPDYSVRRYQFNVEISTTAHCTKIKYDLILDVQLPNGQVKKVRKPRFVKLNDSSFEELVQHELPLNQSVTNYEAKLVSCNVCDLGV